MAATQKRTPCLRLLLSVTQAEDEHRVVEVLQKNGIPLCFEARAKGTAPSELLDAIAWAGTTRVLTAGLLPRANVPAVFGAINKALSYHKRGAGIARDPAADRRTEQHFAVDRPGGLCRTHC